MSHPHNTTYANAAPGRRRGFWLVLALIAGVCLAAGAYQMWHIIALRIEMVGDGKTVASYNYDLSNLTVPRKPLVASGNVKDGMPAATNPVVIGMDNQHLYKQPGQRIVTKPIIDEFQNDATKVFSRPVVNTDEVIGIVVDGQARAYPMRFMRWHEIVNDTVGDTPVAVTYSPLCDAAVVFDRRVGGEVLEFGYSGLLYNSNLVMYDRRKSPADESLWLQLKFEAIAGQAAGRKLTVLPMTMTDWETWAADHPETTVFIGNHFERRRYKRDPYRMYLEDQELRFPVEPMIDGDDAWEIVWAMRFGDQWKLFDEQVDSLVGALDDDSAGAGDRPAVRCLRFAWHAMHAGKQASGTTGKQQSQTPGGHVTNVAARGVQAVSRQGHRK